MKHLAVRGAASALVLSASVAALAQPSSRAVSPKNGVLPPRATTVAPPSAAVSNPTVPTVNGIAIGAPMSVVDAKCNEAGVSCQKSVRKTKTPLDRVRITFPSGEFTRVFITAKGGSVLSIKARYRAEDPSRFQTLKKAFGDGALRRGVIAWASPSGVVTEMDLRGRSIQYIDTKTAATKGVALTSAAFLAAAPRPESVRPAATGSLSRIRASALGAARLGDLTFEQTPSPSVTNPLKIPVKITLGELRCYDENDFTSWFHGDDPYLNIVGTHTRPDPKAWFIQKAYSDVESGDVRNVNQVIFPEGDARRFVTIGEAVGVQFTLFERDVTTDDEIDFAYPTVDYNFALANQNKTLQYVETLHGDGGTYKQAYKVEIGVGVPDPSAYGITPKYRSVDPQRWAGSYLGSVGDAASDATLTFLQSKDPAYPNGVLYGSFKDGSTVVKVTTLRLQGDNVELFAKYPSGSPGTLFGYLIGEGSESRLVGTLTRDGVTRGVSLTKK